MQFFEKLQILRKQTGMTQGTLAEKMGVSRQAISKWESGTAYPDIKKISELCILFGTDPDTLLDPKIKKIRYLTDPAEPFDPLILGTNLKRIRTARGMGQEMLAELLGVSRQSVSKWETGFSVPKTEVLLTVIDALNTDFSELFYRENGSASDDESIKMPTEAPKSEVEEPAPKTPPEPILPPPSADIREEHPIPSSPPADSLLPHQKESSHRSGKYFGRSLAWILSLSLVLLLSGLILLPNLQKKQNPDLPQPPTSTQTPTTKNPDSNHPQQTDPPETGIPWNGKSDITWYHPTDTEFILYTAEQLAGLAELVNSGAESFENKTIRLGADIDLANRPALPWTPIGGGNSRIPLDLTPEEVQELYGDRNLIKLDGIYQTPASFRGTFLGEGYTVKGLWINTLYHDVGLFGLIYGGTVKDLTVETETCSGADRIGAICGTLYSRPGYESSIENCHATITYLLSGERSVGGIVGEVIAYRQSALIRNCSVTGFMGGHLQNTGGIVGYGEVFGEDCTLTLTQNQCAAKILNLNTRHLSSSSFSLGSNFGGIAGHLVSHGGSELILSRCESTEEICTGTNTLNAGGIVGILETLATGSPLGQTAPGSATVSDCRSIGSVCKNTQRSERIGGIIGLAQPVAITVSHCYSTGDMTAKYECGGICGSYSSIGQGGGIQSCAFTGTLTSTMEHIPEWITKEPEWKYSYAQHSFGGIVGSLGSVFDTGSVLSYCYVNGLIDAQFKGGMIGEHRGGKIQIDNCIASMDTAEALTGLCDEFFTNHCGVLYAKEVTDSMIFGDWITWNTEYWDTEALPPLLFE